MNHPRNASSRLGAREQGADRCLGPDAELERASVATRLPRCSGRTGPHPRRGDRSRQRLERRLGRVSAQGPRGRPRAGAWREHRFRPRRQPRARRGPERSRGADQHRCGARPRLACAHDPGTAGAPARRGRRLQDALARGPDPGLRCRRRAPPGRRVRTARRTADLAIPAPARRRRGILAARDSQPRPRASRRRCLPSRIRDRALHTPRGPTRA